MRNSLLSNAQELRLFSRSRAFGLHFEGVDVVDGQHGGGHEPRQPHDAADLDQNRQDEQVQMVAAAFLQLVLLAVDDHRRDLLVHEDQNSAQQSRNHGDHPRVDGHVVERRDDPASVG